MADENIEYEFEFELLSSEDGKTTTLVCHTSIEVDPTEFANLLRLYADRLETILTMGDAGSTIN